MLGRSWVDCPYGGYCRASTEALCVLDTDGRFQSVNAAWEMISGRALGALLGKPLLDLVPAAARARAATTLAFVQSGELSKTEEHPIVAADQSLHWLRWTSAKPMQDGRVIAAARDVTDVRHVRLVNRALRAVCESSERFAGATEEKELLDSICRAIVEHGGYRAAWVGLAEPCSEPVEPQVEPQVGRRLYPAAHAGQPDEQLDMLRAQSAVRTARPAVERGEPASSVTLPLIADREELGALVIHDSEPDAFEGEELRLLGDLADGVALAISNLRLREQHDRTRNKLVTADRMAAMALLSSGVAHDVNNPLTCVMAGVEWLLGDLCQLGGELPPGRLNADIEVLRDAQDAAERIRSVVADLKTFSRPDAPRPSAVDVREVLDSSVRMAMHLIRYRAHVVKQYSEAPLVLADAARLGQVFLNLLINAAQAIPKGDVDANEIRVVVERTPEGKVAVEVRDSGQGMTADVVERLFDPFFTTKTSEGGTGLGLSISKSIVESYGGVIRVQSEPGRGSVFRVDLEACEIAQRTGVAEPTDTRPVRRGRIAVIDDEWSVCTAIRRALGQEHEISAYSRGELFLEHLSSGEIFDLVLLDVSMPQMTGIDVYRAAVARWPEIADRIVFMSGAADPADPPLEGCCLLDKPFDMAALRQTVATVLEARG